MRFAPDIDEGKKLNINELEGYTGKSLRSGRMTRMAVLFKDDQVYQFIGVVKDRNSNFSNFDNEFLKIINSLRKLKANEEDFSKPLRLTSYTVKQLDTYESLALKSSIHSNAEDQLRLINGDYPDKPLSPGRTIKIVQ